MKSKVKTRKIDLNPDRSDKKYFLQITRLEKGNFFAGSFEFDTVKKFKSLNFYIDNINGSKLITDVFYNQKEIDNAGMGTRDVAMYFDLFCE